MMIRLVSGLMAAAGILAVHAPDHWTAALRPMDKSGVTGTVQLDTQGPDSAKVAIAIDNAPSGVTLHWRLSSGSCTGAGAVVGNETAYPELRTPEGANKAEIKATVAVLPQAGSPYVVQVLGPVPAPSLKEDAQTAADKTHVIACGDLQPSSMNPSN